MQQPPNENHTFLLPEFELNIEPEEDEDLKALESDAEAEARRQATGKELEKKASVDGVSGMEETELMQYASADQDIVFGKFKKRIAGNNDQVRERLFLKRTEKQYQPVCYRCCDMIVGANHFGYRLKVF